MNNNKRDLLKRLTALIMVFAMVLSLSVPALAAETSEEADFLPDLPDVSAAAEFTESVEEEEPADAGDDVVILEEETPEEAPEEAPDASELPDASEEAPAEDPDTEPVVDPEEEIPEEDMDALLNAEPMVWTAKQSKDKKSYSFSTVYWRSGKQVLCKDLYASGDLFHTAYRLPAGEATIGKEKITIPAGVYYFDKDGVCRLPSEDTNYKDAKKLMDHGVYYVVDWETGFNTEKMDYRCVEFTKSTNVKLPSAGELYNGSFTLKDGTVCFAETVNGKKGVVKTDPTTGIWHWFGEKLYTFTRTVKVYEDKTDSKKDIVFAAGDPWTGCHKFGSLPKNEVAKKMKTNVIYYFKNGVPQKSTAYRWWNKNNTNKSGLDLRLVQFAADPANADNYPYGTVYSGAYKVATMPGSLKDVLEENVVYYYKSGWPVKDDKTYHWGGQSLYYFENSEEHNGLSVGTPYEGIRKIGSVPAYLKEVFKDVPKYPAYFEFKNGVGNPYTGAYKAEGAKGYEYYKNGVKAKHTGWGAYKKKYYYFDNSSLAFNTGGKKDVTKTIKGIGNTGKSYVYTFKTDGSLVTNLFSYNASNKAKAMRIKVDNKYHNAIFLLYNSKAKDYNIAALQVICSTPTDKCRNRGEGLAYGKYVLSTTRRWAWAVNEDQNKSYCKCTEIVKWDSYLGKYVTSCYMFHSPQYKYEAKKYGTSSNKETQKKAYHMLYTANYNKIGASNTGGCIRLQTGYCALVQSISSKNKVGGVQVWFNVYNDKGPFGLVKNADVQIPVTQNYDPTTPKDLL